MNRLRFRFSGVGGRLVVGAAVAGALIAASAAPAAASVGRGNLFLHGDIVGTIVAPAPVPIGSGRDPFYSVTNGAPGQLGIAGVGPGDAGYHGGEWEFFAVTFNTAPYLLTSGEAVMAAEASGDVTVLRLPGRDFRCPVTRS